MLREHLIKELQANLNHFNQARTKCLALIVCSLLRHRTVNLTILATENLCGTKNESCYRRFQNFFLRSNLPLDGIASMVLKKLPCSKEGWTLAMDRTNWKHGKCHINILTVGVVVNKVAIPIAWKVLPQATKRGNSNTKQRIGIMSEVLKLFPSQKIKVLTMDREFGSKLWLSWLNEQKVDFVVRIKSEVKINTIPAFHYRGTQNSKKMVSALDLELFFASKPITVNNRRDGHLDVLSNRFSGKEALELYRQRWAIEQLFSHLKKRGFDLESTHITDAAKLEKLFALVTLAFVYSFAWGAHLRTTQKQTKAMKRKSIFRQGLESILRLLNNPHLHQHEIDNFLHWLKTPKFTSIFVV